MGHDKSQCPTQSLPIGEPESVKPKPIPKLREPKAEPVKPTKACHDELHKVGLNQVDPESKEPHECEVEIYEPEERLVDEYEGEEESLEPFEELVELYESIEFIVEPKPIAPTAKSEPVIECDKENPEPFRECIDKVSKAEVNLEEFSKPPDLLKIIESHKLLEDISYDIIKSKKLELEIPEDTPIRILISKTTQDQIQKEPPQKISECQGVFLVDFKDLSPPVRDTHMS